MTCRLIPGYPKIDNNNDYLIARFDDVIIDALSWKRDLLPDIVTHGAKVLESDSNPDRQIALEELFSLEVSTQNLVLQFSRHDLASRRFAY